jgi:hypothetical protein
MVKRTDNTMVKRKRTTGQIMICKTLHRKLKIEKHESNKITRENSGAPEGVEYLQNMSIKLHNMHKMLYLVNVFVIN